jgi:hypothetical protein
VRLFVEDGSGAEIGFEPRDVVLAGYTGRDQEAVRRHVEELAAHSVPAPDSVPAFFRVTPDRVVVADRISVLGNETSGEGEFLIFRWADELWIGVASDHTDRACERDSIRLSKQLCPKPVCPRVWRYADVAAHWDRVVLRSFCGDERPDQLYQEGPAAALLDPETILTGAAGRARVDVDAGLLVFSGTLSILGELRFAGAFAVELVDEERGTRLRVEYVVDVADPLD